MSKRRVSSGCRAVRQDSFLNKILVYPLIFPIQITLEEGTQRCGVILDWMEICSLRSPVVVPVISTAAVSSVSETESECDSP